MAIEGYGVAWLPQSAVVDELERGVLVRAGGDNHARRSARTLTPLLLTLSYAGLLQAAALRSEPQRWR